MCMVAEKAHGAHTPLVRLSSLLPVTRRQDQVHGRSLAVALPLDLGAELLGKAVDQPAAEPGIGALCIEPFSIVGDRQAKLAGAPL